MITVFKGAVVQIAVVSGNMKTRKVVWKFQRHRLSVLVNLTLPTSFLS